MINNVDMFLEYLEYPGYVALGASNSLNFMSGRYADSGKPQVFPTLKDAAMPVSEHCTLLDKGRKIRAR